MREKYESLSLAVLKDLAKARGMKGISTLRKPALIERMLEEDETGYRDMCLRAYGALTNCALLPVKELTAGMVKVKLGVALGFFRALPLTKYTVLVCEFANWASTAPLPCVVIIK